MLWNVAWERPVCEKSVSTTTSHVEDRLTPEGWLALVFGETCILPWQISPKKMLNRRQLLSQSWLCWVCPSRNRSGLDALPSNWAQGPVAETSPFVHRGPLTLYYDIKTRWTCTRSFFEPLGKCRHCFFVVHPEHVQVDPVDSRRGRKLSLPKFVCNECPSLQSLLRRTEISGGDLRVNPFAKLNYEASIRAKHWVVCLDQTRAMATKPVAKRHNPTISRFLSGKKRRRINWLGLTQFGVDQFHKTTDAPHHTSSHSHGIMTSTVTKTHTRSEYHVALNIGMNLLCKTTANIKDRRAKEKWGWSFCFRRGIKNEIT